MSSTVDVDVVVVAVAAAVAGFINTGGLIRVIQDCSPSPLFNYRRRSSRIDAARRGGDSIPRLRTPLRSFSLRENFPFLSLSLSHSIVLSRENLRIVARILNAPSCAMSHFISADSD